MAERPLVGRKQRRRFFNPVDAFWDRTQKGPSCWIWMGLKDMYGYGRHWSVRRHTPAHRFSYELHKGPIPKGLVIDHLCRVPLCVNPDHLEAVTHAENLRRSPISSSGRATPLTHCKRGHEYTPENIKLSKGRRFCRECARFRARANYRIQRGA